MSLSGSVQLPLCFGTTRHPGPSKSLALWDLDASGLLLNLVVSLSILKVHSFFFVIDDKTLF